jgi:hypothetical protein
MVKEHMQALGKAVEQSGVPKKTLELVRFRSSRLFHSPSREFVVLEFTTMTNHPERM